MALSWLPRLLKTKSRPAPRGHCGRVASARRPRKAHLGLEALETRLAPVVGSFAIPPEVAPGTGYDGVVRLEVLDHDDNIDGIGTGTLLSTGRHILTAAHNVQTLNSTRVVFEMPGGEIAIDVPATHYRIYPGYKDHPGVPNDPNNPGGPGSNDIAVLELPVLAPAGAERFDLFRGTNEVGQLFTTVGYGLTGTGTSGESVPLGVKHIGHNRFDADANWLSTGTFNEHIPPPAAGTALAWDFDNGADENDAFYQFYGIRNLWLGPLEANPATGDSGGPLFIGNQIAGVVSYSDSDVNLHKVDINQKIDSSYGEFGIGTRVSDFATWIDQTVSAPGPLVLDMTKQPTGNDGKKDFIVLSRSGTNLQIVINNKLVQFVPAAQITSLTVIGSNDSEDITLDLDAAPGLQKVVGGGGINSLFVSDLQPNDGRSYVLGSSYLVRGEFERFLSYEGVQAVEVHAGSGADTFDVQSIDPDTHTTLKGGFGGDTFLVYGMDPGFLSVIGGDGSDTLDVHDEGYALGATYKLDAAAGHLTRPTPGTPKMPDIGLGGLEALTVFAGSGADTFDVLSTATGTSTTLNGGGGDDTFEVRAAAAFTTTTLEGGEGRDTFLIGGPGGLDALPGMVNVVGHDGDTVEVRDQQQTLGSTYLLDSTGLIRLTPEAETFRAVNYEGVETVKVLGGSGPNTFKVLSNAAGTVMTLEGGANNDTFRLTTSNLGALAGLVSVTGNGGFDTLEVRDETLAVGATYQLTAANLKRSVPGVPGVAEVNYGGVEALMVFGGAGANTFDIQATAAGTLTTLKGGANADTFRFHEGAPVNVTVDGQGGSDTLDYSALTTAVTVNLAGGTAPRTGGISAIENVFGGAGADSLTGSAGDNILRGNGGNDTLVGGGGNDVLVGGDGADTISGGAGRDLLIGGRGSDALSGGDGEDILIDGFTGFDSNLTKLQSVMAEWSSATPIATRVGHLQGTIPGGLNSVYLIGSPTVPTTPAPGGINPGQQNVFTDGVVDRLMGEAGVDWFFLFGPDVTDRVAGEFFTETGDGTI
jgi:hypothetical protein